MDLSKVTSFLNQTFNTAEVPDSSVNGLQVEGHDTVNKILLCVDISLENIRYAIKYNYDMIIVHHGLFWSKECRITGYLKNRLSALLANDISVYAAHLPMDIDMSRGHNAYLADLLGLTDRKPFVFYKGLPLGIMGRFPETPDTADVVRILKKDHDGEYRVFDSGKKHMKAAVISGDAGSLYEEVIRSDADIVITGELTHAVYHPFLESGKSFVFMGHYNSERGGMLALADALSGEFPELAGVDFHESDTGL